MAGAADRAFRGDCESSCCPPLDLNQAGRLGKVLARLAGLFDGMKRKAVAGNFGAPSGIASFYANHFGFNGPATAAQHLNIGSC